jgi:hypothetical protein
LRWIVLLTGAIFRTGLPYRLLGLVNRRLPVLQTVFFCYAGSPAYARRYCYRWSEDWLRETPTPIGVYRQGGRWGLVVASPISEAQIVDSSRREQLERLIGHVEWIASAIGAENVRLAGILPGHLRRQGRGAATRTRDTIARVVHCSLTRVRDRHAKGAPIVLLGGDGYLGRAVQRELRRAGEAFHVIDSARGVRALPHALRSRSILLLDLSRSGVLRVYAEQVAPGSVVLNEVFPEPDHELVRAFRRRQISVFHIAGVRARVIPALPGGYTGAVPCCAVHGSGSIDPVIRKLEG